MGFGTVFGTIAFMFIFASMILFTVQTQKNLTEQANEQRLALERDRAERESALAISATGYAVGVAVDWTTTTYADFAAGTLANTTAIAPGSVTLVGPTYGANGTWTSPVLDTGDTDSNLTVLTWTAILPSGTTLAFQTRGGDTPVAVTSSPFTGPDGTVATAYTLSGTALNATVHDGRRYVQVRAILGTTNPGATPELQEAAVGVRRPGGVATVTVRNAGSEKLPHDETDLYLAGERVPRNATHRQVDYGSSTDQVLWLPGESVTYSVFRTVPTPTGITVANGPARAAGTVS